MSQSTSSEAVARREHRDATIVAMYADGQSSGDIGPQFDVSEERVRQIVRAAGLERTDGGAAIRNRQRLDTEAKKRQAYRARFAKYYGCPYEEIQRIRTEFGVGRDPVDAFRDQRRFLRRANPRVRWTLTLPQWWSVWKASRAWRYKRWMLGSYGMERINPRKGWVLGNVHIVRTQARKKAAIRTKRLRDRHVKQRYGCTLAALQRVRSSAQGRDPIAVFRYVRCHGRQVYGEDAWGLTLLQWWRLWQDHWSRRREYRLVRRDPRGSWTVGNVFLEKRSCRTYH